MQPARIREQAAEQIRGLSGGDYYNMGPFNEGQGQDEFIYGHGRDA